MGKKDYQEPQSYGAHNERFANRGDKGWENMRDSDRDPEPRDPGMDRYAVGTNDPQK